MTTDTITKPKNIKKYIVTWTAVDLPDPDTGEPLTLEGKIIPSDRMGREVRERWLKLGSIKLYTEPTVETPTEEITSGED